MQGVYWRRSWGSRREGEGKEERVKEKQAGIRLEVGGDRHSIPSKRTRTWTRTRTRTQKMEWDEAPFIGEGWGGMRRPCVLLGLQRYSLFHAYHGWWDSFLLLSPFRSCAARPSASPMSRRPCVSEPRWVVREDEMGRRRRMRGRRGRRER